MAGGEHSFGMCLEIVFTQQLFLQSLLGIVGHSALVSLWPHPVPTLALPLLCLWHLEAQLGEGKWLPSQCGLHPTLGGQWCCGSLFAASGLHFEKHSSSSWSFSSIPFPSEGRAHFHQTFHPDIQETFLRTSSIPGMEERLLDWESFRMVLSLNSAV